MKEYKNVTVNFPERDWLWLFPFTKGKRSALDGILYE